MPDLGPRVYAAPGFGHFRCLGQQHQVNEPGRNKSANPGFPERPHANRGDAERPIEDGNVAHALAFDHAEHSLKLAREVGSMA